MLAFGNPAFIGYDQPRSAKDILREQMNRNLIVVEGAYADSIWKDKQFSVSLPNSWTGFKLIECYDGDQPSYENAAFYEQVCNDVVGYCFTIADYPVTGDTLRFAFYTRDDAEAFLNAITE